MAIAAGSFAKWFVAKARGATAPARITIIGDSNVAGEGAGTGTAGLTGGRANSFANLFANLGAFRTDSFFGDQNVPSAGVGYNAYDPRITEGTGWQSDTIVSEIPGGRYFVASGGSVGKLKFTPSGSFCSFRVWYPQYTGLNTAFTVSVDGTLVDTINQAGSTALLHKDYSVSKGTHFIEFGVGASGTGYVVGVETFDGSATPNFHQLGFGGAKAADFDFAAEPWNSKLATATLSFDYAILYCTLNDTTAATALNNYYANVSDFVSALNPTADGCLCVGYPGNTNGTTNGYLDQMATVLQNIAADYDWSFYDFRTTLGHSNARASALGYRYDDSHPNTSGHAEIANALYGFLAANGL